MQSCLHPLDSGVTWLDATLSNILSSCWRAMAERAAIRSQSVSYEGGGGWGEASPTAGGGGGSLIGHDSVHRHGFMCVSGPEVST